MFFRIRFPNSLPYFFAGLRVSSTLAVIGAVIGEFVGSDVGLGYLIVIANNQMDTALGIASIFLLQRDFDSASRAFDAARNRTHDKNEMKFLSAAIGDLATIRVR